MPACHLIQATPFWLVAGAVRLNSSLLTLSVIAVVLPAAFNSVVQPTDGIDPLTNLQEGQDILSISHGVCIFLLQYPSKLMFIYPGCRYLGF